LNSQGTFAALLGLAFYMARRVDAREDKRAALVARADQQQGVILVRVGKSAGRRSIPTE
jgi:hypothetical protein